MAEMAEQAGWAVRKAPRGTLPLDEIHRRYEGQWVIVHVVAFDERRVPKQGKVLFHSPDQDEVDRAVAAVGDRPLRIFLAEPRPPFGPEDVRLLEELAARLNAQLEADRGGVAS